MIQAARSALWWGLITLLVLFQHSLSSLTSSSVISVVRENPGGVTLQFHLDEAQFQSREVQGHRVAWFDLGESAPSFEENDGVALPHIFRLVAVPPGHTVQGEVLSAQYRSLKTIDETYRDRLHRRLREVRDSELVTIGDPGRMRYLRVAPVVINPFRLSPQNGNIEQLTQLTLNLTFIPQGDGERGELPSQRYWSPLFEELFSALVINYSSPFSIQQYGGAPIARGSYLIITDSALARHTTELVNWKKRKGYNVVVAPIYRPGIGPDEIRRYIQDAYAHWERPPEVVLLIGDVNMPGIQLPAFTIRHPHPQQNEIDVTDLPYSLMDDQDYLPDLMVGRISVDSPSPTDLLTYIARVINHERDIANFPSANFHRATLFAGNFGDGNLPVLSPVETCVWLGTRLRERGWQVDEFYYRRPGDDINPGPIIASINRGVNIVAYRGWADANGTHYPQFYRTHIQQLDNGPFLPIWTFFVCNTGDFGNNNINPAFGEVSIVAGSRRRPTGALLFYGPSDLHTNTRFNNPMLGGWYGGLLYKGVRNVSALALLGKLEIWGNNPDFRHRGHPWNFVEFYFSVYNILGDPDLSYYFDPPRRMTVQHPGEVFRGQSQLRMVVRKENGEGLGGAIVTLQGALEGSILTDREGTAWFPIQNLTSDTIQISVFASNYAPYLRTIPVREAERMVGITGAEVRNDVGGNQALTGRPLDITFTLRNFGTQRVEGVRLEVLESPYYTIEASEVVVGNLDPSQSLPTPQPLRITLASNLQYGTSVPIEMLITTSQNDRWEALHRLTVAGPDLRWEEITWQDPLEPGGSSSFYLTLFNRGGQRAQGVYGILHTHDNSVEITDANGRFGTLEVRQRQTNADDPFGVRALPDVTPGRVVIMRLDLFNQDHQSLGTLLFPITIGTRRTTDPVGPDQYGYYAYDDTDTAYALSPRFNWVELDGNYGGTADRHFRLTDDQTVGVPLPFPFTFYGEQYDSLFICSNGWVSFAVRDPQSEWDFNNHPIPSPLGPRTMIAPYWEDLVGRRNQLGQRDSLDVFIKALNNPRRVIVEWSRVVARSGNDEDHEQTFQVILFHPEDIRTPSGDGEILFQYLRARLVDRGTDNTFASAGIQDYTHLRGLGLTYANRYTSGCDSIRDNRAILITTRPPDGYLKTKPDPLHLPTQFALFPPFPNPFNPTFTLRFSIPYPSEVNIGLFDLQGRLVSELFSGLAEAGLHQLHFSPQALPTGTYLIRMEAAGKIWSERVQLVK